MNHMQRIEIGLFLSFYFMFIASPIPVNSFSHEERIQKALRFFSMGGVARKWICIPQIKNVCGFGRCKPIAPADRFEIYFRKGTFRRCFKGDCKAYPFKFEVDGVFSIVTYGPSAFLKAGNLTSPQ